MSNPRVSEEFLEQGREKFGRKRQRQRLKRRTQRQEIREGFLAGIKAQRLHDQEVRHTESLYADLPPFSCEGDCGRTYQTVEVAWESLVLHHAEHRSKGRGWRRGVEFGVDAPSNLKLVCRVCHQNAHPGPMYGF